MDAVISAQLSINRVTLRLSEAADKHQRADWQRRTTSALSRVSLHTTLPPQAILVVRHLSDPKPGRLLAGDPWQGVRAWEQAAHQALKDCWRTAVRPAQAVVPSNANSVWFADQAEWLACLSWDLYRGVAGDLWWWQTTLRAHTYCHRSDTQFQLWQAAAQWLPATLTTLFEHQGTAAVQILSTLLPVQAQQLLVAVTRCYSCPLPSPVLDSPASADLTPLVMALQPHLTSLVQQAMDILPSTTQVLLAVCLTLPQTAELLAEVRSPEKNSVLPSALPPDESVDEVPPQPQTFGVLPIAPASEQAEVSNAPSLTTPPAVPLSPKVSMGGSAPPDADRHPVRDDAIISDALDNNTALPPLVPPAIGSSPASAPSIPAIDSSTPLTLASPALLNEVEQGIATGVGGLWYLVNVLVALDWPQRSAVMTPWHQLAALAQAFLPEVPREPVWGLLAAIAGDAVPHELLTQWQTQALVQVRPSLANRLDHPEAIATYLTEPATLYLTRTHVDVMFTLDQIQLDVRLAGLDQDPGWVPDLARVIAFHYE